MAANLNRKKMIMTRPTSPVIMSPEQARAEARRINEKGIAEELIARTVLIEDSAWTEFLEQCRSKGTSASREFRRFVQREVKRS